MSERERTRGERNIAWIEKHCRIPEGMKVGQPVRLAKFQKDFIRKIYDNPKKTRRAILSMPRKNAKTSICAFLVLLHTVGPEARRNSQLYSTALSREQAAILFNLAAKCARMSPTLAPFLDIKETRKEIICPRIGTVYRALSSEAKTALGLSPCFVIHDEAGAIRGPRSELYEALETASAAQADPLSIVISTQAPNDGDLLSLLIDDAATGADPRTVLCLHTAPDDMDPFSEEALIAANPAFFEFQNQDELRAMAADAKRMPSRQAEFMNLILNQRVEVLSPFISKGLWDENADEPEPIDGKDLFCGLDLSAVSDLTALVAVHRSMDGRFSVNPMFWLPADGLPDKARKDKVPYDLWANDGHLIAVPGRVISYDFVAHRLYEMYERANSLTVAFDRYNIKFLKPHLISVGFSEKFIEDNFKPHGQGYKDMSPALRTMESAILENRVRHGAHPVLTMCVANSKVMSDPAGNRKLVKFTDSRKIDGAVAMAMGLAVISRDDGDTSKRSYLETDGLLVL